MKEHDIRRIFGDAGIDVVGRGGAGWLSCRCPFAPYSSAHKGNVDGKPSFFVHVNEVGVSGGHCFTCDEKGRVGIILHKLWRLTRERRYQQLSLEADLCDIPEDFGEFEDEVLDPDPPEPINPYVYAGMFEDVIDNEWACKFLQRRRVNERTADELGLLYDPDESRILFPVYDGRGDLFGYTGRTILPEHQYPYQDYPKVKNYAGLQKEWRLLGEHLMRPGKMALVVEGLFAFAASFQRARRGFDPVAAMGARLSEAQAEILIDRNVPVMLMFDNDDAGRLGTEKAVEKLVEHVPVMVGEYPEGKEDPDEITGREWREIYEGNYEIR